MKKYLLLLLVLLFTGAAFGQSYEGSYRAQFISLGNSAKPVVEFEVQSNGAVKGQVIVGAVVTAIAGQIDGYGNLEAQTTGGSVQAYTLKADMNRGGGRITLTGRSEEKGAGSQNFSSSVMRGNYSRIVKAPAAEISKSSVNMKSELLIEQSTPFFEKEFSGITAKITTVKEDFVNVYNLEMIFDEDKGNRRAFYFTLAKPPESGQTIWKIENIRFIRYIEKTDNYNKVNNFYSEYEIWKKNRELSGGQIELLSSNAQQMIFKITNLKIKNVDSNETATINGTLYAEISR